MRPVPPAPSLSVVLPVRDVAAYLPDMLTSLVRNAADLPGRLEIIVVDDASADATPELATAFSSSLPLQVIRHDEAVGAASARNVGLDAASGTYVTFLDGDDWLAPGYLRELVAAVDGLGVDFVRVDHVQVRDRERVTHLAPEARRGVVLDPRSGIGPANRRTMVDYPYAWAGVYRRDLGDALRFEPGLHTATDRPWIFRLHRETRSYAVVSLAGVFYRRQVANSLTQINDERQLHFLDAYAAVLRDAAGDDEIEAKAVRQFLAVLAHHLAADKRFSRELRHRMRERAAVTLARLPRQVLADTVRYDRRLAAVHPLLPADLRPRAAS